MIRKDSYIFKSNNVRFFKYYFDKMHALIKLKPLKKL